MDTHFAQFQSMTRVTLAFEVSVPNADGTVQPDPPSPVSGYLALGDTDPVVQEVLAIMGKEGPLDWVELYKVYEVVRDAVRPQTIVGLGWATKATESAFTGSANRPDVSGEGARHARMSGDTPKNRMTLEDGRAFISGVVLRWLEESRH